MRQWYHIAIARQIAAGYHFGMIYDRLPRLGLYADAIPFLGELIYELGSIDLDSIPVGTYYTNQSGIKYMVQEYATVPEKKSEVHGEYADVQILLSGSERFGAFRAIEELPDGFSAEGDIGFLDSDDEVDIPLREGTFVIVLPFEPHTPGLQLEGEENVRKIVAKIPYVSR